MNHFLLIALGLLVRVVAARADDAATVYAHACACCHGATGHGDGPAAVSPGEGFAPRPRDFTRGKFKLRSTPSGQLPTDADLLRTIERGIPRYMPAFTGSTANERRLAMEAVKRFYPGFARTPPTPIAIPQRPTLDAAAVARGTALYQAAGCVACHGATGRGDGASAKDLKDGTGLRITPADLRVPRNFKNGGTPDDVYRTIVTGLDDTPMASYADALTAAQRWDLVAFIASLAQREPPGGARTATAVQRGNCARKRATASSSHSFPVGPRTIVGGPRSVRRKR